MGPRVALLGTGIMGSGMARNIAKTDMPLRVWNRTRERAEPLRESGAMIADSPAEAVRDADIVVTMLFDANATAEVMNTALDDLPRNATWVQMSTVGLDGTAGLAALAGAKDIAFIDAPVLGSKPGAEQGGLIVLASGPAELRAQVGPVLEAVGSKTTWVGDRAGMASRLKLVLNAWVLSLTAATAQSVALAKALGLDEKTFLETIAGSPTDSQYAQIKGTAMINGEYGPAFTLEGAAKDSDLILAALRDTGTTPVLMAAISELMHRADELGHGKEDMAAVRTAF